MPGNQPHLSTPKLHGHASMFMEPAKCSFGNLSSKTAPSVKLNKTGSGVATPLIQDAGSKTPQIIKLSENRTLTSSIFHDFLFFLFIHVCVTLPCL